MKKYSGFIPGCWDDEVVRMYDCESRMDSRNVELKSPAALIEAWTPRSGVGRQIREARIFSGAIAR